MNEKELPEVKEIMKEWMEELDKLEPLETDGNIFNNSLNKPRIDLEIKYKKKIEEAIRKHSEK